MNRTQLLLLEITKLAIGALGSEAPPPPATEPGTPTRRVRRKRRRKAARIPAPAAPPAKHRGRPKGSKDYICTDCKHAFRAVDPASCPHCNGGNFVLKKDYNLDTL